MAIKVNANASNRAKTVVSAKAASVSTVSAASAIKIGKLEDNVGNLDVGDGLETGETIVYNAETKTWVATSIEDEVSKKVDEKLSSGNIALALDGGTF
jgi:cytidylate kinase